MFGGVLVVSIFFIGWIYIFAKKWSTNNLWSQSMDLYSLSYKNPAKECKKKSTISIYIIVQIVGSVKYV